MKYFRTTITVGITWAITMGIFWWAESNQVVLSGDVKFALIFPLMIVCLMGHFGYFEKSDRENRDE